MPGDKKVLVGPDGIPRELHSPQNHMAIRYGMNGSRQIRVDKPDGSRIVLASRGVPYVQKPWNFGAQAFDHRTYVDNGVLTHQFYRRYAFGGTTLDAYAPQRFYSQDFYKWAAKPQLWTPPAWSYTTKQEAWYTHYQGYFTPQPSYASPVFWLTDFVLATSLFEAYNAHPLPAQAPPSIPATSTSQPSAPQPPSASPLIQAPVAQSPVAQAPVAQAPLAQAPIAQAPIARAPASPVAAAPAPAPTPLGPLLTTPVAPAPVAPSPVVPAPVVPAPVVPAPVVPAPPDEPGASLTIWERFTNYIRGLLGETPTETATPSPATPSPEPPVASNAAPITDDVKNKVADEIQAQLAEEAHEADGSARNLEPKAGAGGVVEELARPAQHVFVVASDLDLVDDTGRRCMITEGDVVQILSAADAASGTAPGIVLSSKGGTECALSARVDIAVSDLQEMQNHMRAAIDQGLANTPKGASEPTATPAFAQAAPPPDPDANSEIENQKTIAASVGRG